LIQLKRITSELTSMSTHETRMESPLITAPRRLAVIAAASFLIPMLVLILVYGVIEKRAARQEQAQDMTPERIAQRIRPFETIQVAGTAQVSPRAPVVGQQAQTVKSGESIYSGTCMACHGSGVAGAPKFGDHAAWQPRVQQGLPVLVDHAIHGKGAMPPKGGNAALTDEEIRSAVQYMTQAAGG
jgi:cytochrome c5